MKYLKKLLVGAAAAALLSAGILTGCGGPPSTLEGTMWEVQQMTSGGADMTALVESMGGMHCEFKDGQLVMTVNEKATSVPYSYSEGTLLIEEDQGTFNGDTITFRVGGDTLVLKRK